MKVQVTYGGRTRTIGEIQGDTYYTRRQESVHLHRKTDSWGIDQQTLKEKLATMVMLICVIDTESETDYWTTPEMYLKCGFYLQFDDHRLQQFLPRLNFYKTAKEALAQKQTLAAEDQHPNLFKDD